MLALFGRRSEWPFNAITESVEYLAEIQNSCYDNRHRPDEAWRWGAFSWRRNGGCTQPETRGREIFYFNRA